MKSCNCAHRTTTTEKYRNIFSLWSLEQFISNFCLETSFIFFFWLNDRNAAWHSVVGALFIIIIHFFSKHRDKKIDRYRITDRIDIWYWLIVLILWLGWEYHIYYLSQIMNTGYIMSHLTDEKIWKFKSNAYCWVLNDI